MTYGYIGSMRAKQGRRDDVAAMLVGGCGRLRALGCLSYIVSLAQDDDDTILVTEVWRSKAAHDASLERAEVRAAIDTAMPLLTGEFTSRELQVVGGLGA